MRHWAVIGLILGALLPSACIDNPSGLTTGFSFDDDTAEQGSIDALKDLEKGSTRIIRYDLPLVRTGNVSTSFDEFGIEEAIGSSTVEYAEGYNRVMDGALIRRFGDAYLLKRDQILPPKGARLFEPMIPSSPSYRLRKGLL